MALGGTQNLASDLWAVGWICWEIITNKVPFDELRSESAIALKVVEGQVPAARENEQLSQIIGLCSLMIDCWAFDPLRRPKISRCRDEIKRMPSLPPLWGKTSYTGGPSAGLLCEMGWVHQLQGSHTQAIQLFNQALSTATSTDDHKVGSRALSGLGDAYYQLSDFSQAENYFTASHDICTLIGDHPGQADASYSLAKVYRDQYKLVQAEQFFTRAENIYSLTGDDRGRANALRGLGSIFHQRSQHVKAKRLYAKAIDIFACVGDDLGQANTLWRLGWLCRELFQYAKAEKCFIQALKIYTRIGDKVGRANALQNLGRLYHVQGLDTKAAPLLAQAGDLYAATGVTDLERLCSLWLAGVLGGGGSVMSVDAGLTSVRHVSLPAPLRSQLTGIRTEVSDLTDPIAIWHLM